MNGKGELEPGDVFKTATDDVWWVERTSLSGAFCIHLSAHPAPITTRKRVTKIVRRHLSSRVFSLCSAVDLVDPKRLDSVVLRKRLTMARKEGAVAEAENSTTETAPKNAPPPRVAQHYKRTDKVPAKELRGQGKETLDAMASGESMTAEEVAAKCVYAGSRQEKTRVAGFYLSQFKKDGLVTVVPEATPGA